MARALRTVSLGVWSLKKGVPRVSLKILPQVLHLRRAVSCFP
jgi:hypothetical protein